jgi:acylphosphatase
MRAAKTLELTGWVRNRFNGSVEMVAEGDEEKLKILLESVGLGPTSAQVSQVDHTWSEAAGEFKDFKIRMTG